MSELLTPVSQRISREWISLGLELAFDYNELQQINMNHTGNIQNAILDMLQRWKSRSAGIGLEATISQLKQAFESDIVGRRDLSVYIDKKLSGNCFCT